MTIAHLDLPLAPEPHGFRAVLDGRRRARIAKGRDKDHERRLSPYQQAVHLAGLDWIDQHGRTWPHYDGAAVFLGAIFWLHRPTTYRVAEVWHRTRRGGPTHRGGDKTSMLRAVEDALQKALYRDDGQVALSLEGKPLLARGDAPHVELFVAGIADAGPAIALMLRRLPIRQDQPGPQGQTRNPGEVPPVISEDVPCIARSIPGLSSPLPSILFDSVQNLDSLQRGR